MAGRPKRRERLAREAVAARRPVAAAVRREAEALAEQHGAATASRLLAERGERVSPSLIRTWGTRAAQRTQSARRAISPPAKAAPTAPVPVNESALSRAEQLRLAASDARAAQKRAQDRADQQIRKGQSGEARNSETVAGLRATRAAELEEAARREELHEAAIATAQAEQVLHLIGAAFEAIGVATTGAVADLLTELMRHAHRGSTLTLPQPVAEQARTVVEQAFRQRLAPGIRAEAIAQQEAERAPAAEAESEPGEPDAPGDGDGEQPGWTAAGSWREDAPEVEGPGQSPPAAQAVPAEFLERFGNAELAAHEWENAQLIARERAAPSDPLSQPSRFAASRWEHPYLRGGG